MAIGESAGPRDVIQAGCNSAGSVVETTRTIGVAAAAGTATAVLCAEWDFPMIGETRSRRKCYRYACVLGMAQQGGRAVP
jgi:hypothetical protein